MANKHSIMTREMVESFCNSYYISDEVHPTAPGQDRTITQFPKGKVGVYTRLFDYCGYRIPLTKFFVSVLKYFRIHISQLSPFGAARISHFEVLTCVLDLGPSVAVFRVFYTRMYSDGLFLFAKRSLSAPSCLSKPPDSIKNWADHFFWVDSRVFPISVPLYTGGVLEKDPAPHLTARQEQAGQCALYNQVRISLAHSKEVTLLLCSVYVPPQRGNFNIPECCCGTARIYLCPPAYNAIVVEDGDLITMKFIHAKWSVLRQPIFIARLSRHSGQMVSRLIPDKVEWWPEPSDPFLLCVSFMKQCSYKTSEDCPPPGNITLMHYMPCPFRLQCALCASVSSSSLRGSVVKDIAHLREE
ncbi:hypothetical protein Tco_1363523 [Tanacetum coccineum]